MDTVAIFGVGLIGGSFALALRKAGFQGKILGVSSEETVPAALELLADGGRIAVLAYHSLEDRIVKQELARRTSDPTPPGLPVQLMKPEFRLLTRGAERPGESEITANPRAASARLRAAERTKVTA